MVQAARRKYHYIYKITRMDESGRYYIGMHSTDNLDDGYFGSGKLITASIKKHSKEKHLKEILEHLPTREALKLREKELVNDDLIGDRLCMNLKLGGEGGWPSLSIEEHHKRGSNGGRAYAMRLASDTQFASARSKLLSETASTTNARVRDSDNVHGHPFFDPAARKNFARWQDPNHQ